MDPAAFSSETGRGRIHLDGGGERRHQTAQWERGEGDGKLCDQGLGGPCLRLLRQIREAEHVGIVVAGDGMNVVGGRGEGTLPRRASLKKEIERLSFGPAPAEAAASPPHAAEEPRLSLVAGGAPEPPLPADTRADARSAAPFVTRLLPNPRKGRAPSTRRGAVGKDPRGLNSVGARGFEPPTFCSQMRRRVAGGDRWA